MITSTVIRLWSQLNKKRKVQLGFLLIMMVLTSFAEVISIGSIFPFLSVLISPEKIYQNNEIQFLITFFDIKNQQELQIWLTAAFISAACIAGAMRIALLFTQIRMSLSIGSDLSNDLFKATVYQPYSVHISRNSSEVIAGITGKINMVVYSGLVPILTSVSSIIIAMAIVTTVTVINPIVAVTILFGFGTIYILIAIFTRKQLDVNSKYIGKQTNNIVKILQESIGGIRDILINNSQHYYCRIYERADKELRKAEGNNQIIAGSPRYIVEALGVTFIASIALLLTKSQGGASNIIPTLGMLAIAAQRLLPAFQQCFIGWSNFKGAQVSINDVLNLIQVNPQQYVENKGATKIKFEKFIKLENISFKYSNNSEWILNNINLEIIKGDCIGIIGKTGSGKSTILDLIMGLLNPNNGQLLVDNIEINPANVKSWQSKVAHVPQTIYLSDATIAENIAFNVEVSNIDFSLVKKVAKKANIHTTIESWPKGYNTNVGERGVKLSGGQIQRIAIARALYKNASVIVFDEATSALDGETENLVMDNIAGLDKDKTIIMVAHRLSSLKNCNVIFEIDNGKVKSYGKYYDFIN